MIPAIIRAELRHRSVPPACMDPATDLHLSDLERAGIRANVEEATGRDVTEAQVEAWRSVACVVGCFGEGVGG